MLTPKVRLFFSSLILIIFFQTLEAAPPWKDWSPSGKSSDFKIQTRNPLHPAANIQSKLSFAFSSDLHGWLSASMFYPDFPPQGLLHIASILEDLRNKDPELLLLDSGDTLQGSPSAFYYSYVNEPADMNSNVLPVIELMNRLKYDATVLGNHDFDVPVPLLQRMINRSNFPWLSGNTHLKSNFNRSNQSILPPYRVLERNGIRIGILGLTTPGIPLWNDPEKVEELSFSAMKPYAEHWTKVLREQEQVDWIVGLFHSGANSKYDGEIASLRGLPLVNASGVIADQVSGIDFIVAGHAHQTSPKQKKHLFFRHRTPLVLPGHSSRGVGVLTVNFKEQNSRWKAGSLEYQFIASRSKASAELISSIRSRLKPVRQWLNEKTSVQFIRLPHRKELELCGAQLTHDALNHIYKSQSFSLLPVWKDAPIFQEQTWTKSLKQNRSSFITRKHLFRWMPYDNFPVQAKLYPRQAELMLEHYRRKSLSRYFRRSGTLEPLGFKAILKQKGSRLELYDQKQRPLNQDMLYQFWMTNYHWNGGSGLAGQALLHSRQKIRQENTHIREVVFQYLQKLKSPLPEQCQVFLK